MLTVKAFIENPDAPSKLDSLFHKKKGAGRFSNPALT
jgi:hypothetical protein